VEPNTTKGFASEYRNADPSTFKAWRYAYDDAGDLVGTSDARGCAVNYFYDAAGRPTAEDWSPCTKEQQDYSSPDIAQGISVQVLYHYDAPDADSPAEFQANPWLLKGRVTTTFDRGSRVVTQYDGRGRVTAVGKQIARPGTPSDDVASRYAPRW